MKSTQAQFADWTTLRKELLAARKAANITQTQLANRMGYCSTTLAHWESGRRRTPGAQGLIDWANALGLDIVFVRRKEFEVK